MYVLYDKALYNFTFTLLYTLYCFVSNLESCMLRLNMISLQHVEDPVSWAIV